MFSKEKTDETLLQYLLGELSPEDCKNVETWLAGPQENRLYFEKFQQTYSALFQTVNREAIRGNYHNLQHRIHRRRVLRNWSRIAAVIVFFIGLSGSLHLIDRTARQKTINTSVKTIFPGSSQAILHLSSGKMLRLDSMQEILREQDGTTIDIQATGQLNYIASANNETNAFQNRLEIPRGGEYRLMLSDGTEIWLNAETELEYPTSFSGNERSVKLNGEAYFHVAKDSLHPFIVEVGEMKVKVYGTQFNISTQNKGKIETVLVDGSVSLIRNKKEIMLRPDHKAEYFPSTGQITVNPVNVLSYIAWKDGNFMFHDESLETIMEKLARWYDIDIFYAHPAAKNIHLSGMLKRYNNIDELFHHFEKISDARFSVKGRTVIINVR